MSPIVETDFLMDFSTSFQLIILEASESQKYGRNITGVLSVVKIDKDFYKLKIYAYLYMCMCIRIEHLSASWRMLLDSVLKANPTIMNLSHYFLIYKMGINDFPNIIWHWQNQN